MYKVHVIVSPLYMDKYRQSVRLLPLFCLYVPALHCRDIYITVSFRGSRPRKHVLPIPLPFCAQILYGAKMGGKVQTSMQIRQHIMFYVLAF